MNDSVVSTPPPASGERQDAPLTLQDYFGAMMLVSLDRTLRDNATNLITRVNRLMRQFGQNRRVLHGFYPAAILTVAAKLSQEAADKLKAEWEKWAASGHLVAIENGGGTFPALPSRHQSAEAVDLVDLEGDLDQWLLDNQKLLESCGLWIEHPATTRGHCHLQSVPPKGGSRRRVFYP